MQRVRQLLDLLTLSAKTKWFATRNMNLDTVSIRSVSCALFGDSQSHCQTDPQVLRGEMLKAWDSSLQAVVENWTRSMSTGASPSAADKTSDQSAPLHTTQKFQDPASSREERSSKKAASVPELDSEANKDLKEEDDVYDPTIRPPLEDFVNFGDFVKWPQFRDAFKSLKGRARFRHVSAAFQSLRGILPRPPNAFLDHLSQIALQNLPEARSNHLARLFYSCGKMRYINSDLMEAMAQKIIKDKHASEMDGCDIAIILYSIAILSRFQVLIFAAEQGMRTVDLYQLYAKETPPILFPSQPELVQSLAKEIAVPNRLVGFRESELANCVYGCGLLRAPEEAALTALAREVSNSHRLLKFSAQELSNIIYGFGLLNFKDQSMLYTISNHLLRTGRLMALDTQHLANILYGFSRIGFVYPPILTAMVKEIKTPERLKRFKEQELANIVSCAALIGIQDEAFYRSLGKEIAKPTRLSKFMEHNFSTMVLGLANVGVRDVQVLKTLAEEMKRPERLPNYTSKDICDIIMGFNNLEFLDDGFMLALVAELRKPQRIRSSDTKVWQSCRAHVFSWSLAFPF